MRLLLVALMIGGIAFAQTGPQFEVASIKPSDPNARGTFIDSLPGGRVSITNMTLKDMITLAWDVQPYQISGGPAWF